LKQKKIKQAATAARAEELMKRFNELLEKLRKCEKS